jgi:hypothetical protein
MSRLASELQLDRISARLLECGFPPDQHGEMVRLILGGCVFPEEMTTQQATLLLNVLYMEYKPEGDWEMGEVLAMGVWCTDEECFTGEDQYDDPSMPTKCSNCDGPNVVLAQVVPLNLS